MPIYNIHQNDKQILKKIQEINEQSMDEQSNGFAKDLRSFACCQAVHQCRTLPSVYTYLCKTTEKHCQFLTNKHILGDQYNEMF